MNPRVTLLMTMTAAAALITCTQIPTAPVAPSATTKPNARVDKSSLAFYNVKLPISARVEDLLGRLTLEEKAAQMNMAAPAIERLGIAPYHWWNEALHGVARNGTATVFPQAIGMAATFDPALHKRMAQVIATEARAKHNAALAAGSHDQYTGLDMWSPNINIFRDPRWGRGQETYGEDPYLTGRMAVAFVQGLQGDDPVYFETIATPKHYAVHSGPEPERHRFDVHPTEQDLYTTYLPAFEAAVREGHAYSVMASYNAVDGLPASANPRLLTEILRKDWGFSGYVVSDVDAVRDVWASHGTVATPEEAAALCVKAGCDLNGGTTYRSLVGAVKQGLITEKEIDVSLRRLLEARFRMGEFDPAGAGGDPYASIPPTAVDTAEHDKVAWEVARESMVLLRNQGQVLPLKRDLGTIAVIGPTADSVPALYANYNGVSSHPVTILQGIRNAVPAGTRVLASVGCPLVTEEIGLAEPVITQFLYTDASRTTHGLLGNYAKNITATTDRLIRGRNDATIDLAFPEQLGRDPLPYTEGLYVKWTGVLVPPDTGDYQVGLAGKDAYRLTLDDKLIVDQFNAGPKRFSGSTVHLEKDKAYALVAEFQHPPFEAPPANAPASATPIVSIPLSQNLPSFTGTKPAGSVDDLAIQLRWTRPTADGTAAGVNGQGLFADSIVAAKAADAVVLVLGITSSLEREQQAAVHYEGFASGDRTTLDLPAVQERLLEQVTAAAGDKPVILVLTSGSALSVNWASKHVPGILQAWYPGEHGDAVADVLFGAYNPAGRLPITMYKSVDGLPAFGDYAMGNRTYRYFKGEPLYPFGYGLSYSTFVYGPIQATASIAGTENLVMTTTVKNTSNIAGDEVVQCYIDRDAADVPTRTLAGFTRVRLNAGEQKAVQFTLTPYQLATVDAVGRRTVNMGKLTIRLGDSATAESGRQVAITTALERPPYAFVPAKVEP